jgi:hypothetical protein
VGQVKLREWVYGVAAPYERMDESNKDEALLKLMAEKHQDLVLKGETSESILAAAASARSKDDFKEKLSG